MPMTEMPPARRFLTRIRKLVSPVNHIFRLLKWVIAVDLFMILLLFGPDQVRELYRITATTSLLSSIALVCCLTLIAVIVLLAARFVAFEADDQLEGEARLTKKLLAVMPLMLAALPLFAAGCGHFFAKEAVVGTPDSLSA